jgi:signal transduction histidine kinase
VPSLRSIPGALSRFPVIVALEALDEWLRDPSPQHEEWLGRCLEEVVSAVGARGAYIAFSADPVPPFAIGFGTLVERPDPASPVALHTLRSRDGETTLGSLWLDAAETDVAVAVRALEMALEAAWALGNVRDTTRRLEALDDAAAAVAGVLDVDAVLQLIVDRVRDLVDTRYAALGIVDRFGGIERFITAGVTAEQREAIGPPPRGHGLLGLIIRDGRSYLIPDIAAHPDSYGFPPGHPPMRSFLGVPVVVKGRAIGNLYLTDKIGAPEFDEADQRIVESFARHAGIAIENARLHDQVQRLAVVAERDRIGKELHDGIIQSLYAVTLSLEDVEDLMRDDPKEAYARVDRSIDTVHDAIRDIRNFILGLRPQLLEGTDLVGALAGIVEEFHFNTVIDVDVDLDEAAHVGAGMDEDARSQIVQIAREALSNAARHSNATRVTVRCGLEGETIRLVVEDNGRGFDVTTPRGGEHQGLVNMRDRATFLGGSLDIDSRPSGGTRIIVTVPLRAGERPT